MDSVSDNSASRLEKTTRDSHGYQLAFDKFSDWCKSSHFCMLHDRTSRRFSTRHSILPEIMLYI